MTNDPAFTLRVKLSGRKGPVMIRAYDDLVPGWDEAGRIRLTVEVRHEGCIVFPKGQLYCALHGASDGPKAKELVMSLVAMRPGDTDADYFASYTPDQIDWASSYGEELGMVREWRYCDPETGEYSEEHAKYLGESGTVNAPEKVCANCDGCGLEPDSETAVCQRCEGCGLAP